MRGDKFWIVIAVTLLFVAIAGTIHINEASKCTDKGGVYLTGKGTWPVCLKAETL